MDDKKAMSRFDGKKLHFNALGWAMVLAAAKRSKMSPKKVVEAAIMRYVRSRDAKKTENA